MSVWRLETAKAELSEVVRQARSEGPQTITVRGEQAVVVLSVEAYAQLGEALPGKTWVDRLRESVIGEMDIERSRDTGRDFAL